MSKASDYFEVVILNVLRGSNPSAITAYVGLFDGDPGDAGTGANEVTTTIRVAGRVAVTFAAPTSGAGSMSNDALVDFGEADDAATVAGYGIFDAASGGNLLVHGTLSSQSVSAGNEVSFAVGTLVVTAA